MAGRSVRELLVRITGDGTQLERALDRSAKRLDATGRRFQTAGRNLSLAFTAPIIAAGAGILALTNSAAEFADTIDKTSIRTGVARGELQQMAFVADQLGVSFDGMTGIVEAFTRRIPQIREGTSDTAKSFQQLGVQLEDSEGNLRAMGDLFPEIIAALSQIGNATERNAIATQIFGRRAFEIVPILEAGGAEVQRLAERFDELGAALSDDEIARLVQYKDSMAEVGVQFRSVGQDIALGFLPILQEQLIPFLQKLAGPDGLIRQWTATLQGLDAEQVKVIATTAGIVGAIGPLLFGFGSVIRTGAAVISTLSLFAGGAAGLGSLLIPGGVLLAGLALLAGAFVKTKIDAAAAAIEMARLKGEILGLSDAERQVRIEQVGRQYAEARRELEAARVALEDFNETRLDDPMIAAGLRIGPVRELRQNIEAAEEKVASLETELLALGDAELKSRQAAQRLKETMEGLDIEIEDVGDKTRKAADVFKDLNKRLEVASELERLLGDETNRAAAEISAYEGALRELLTVEDATEQQVQDVAVVLRTLRGEMAEAAASTKELETSQRTVAALLAASVTPAETYVRQLQAIQMVASQLSDDELARAVAAANEQLERSTDEAAKAGQSWQDQWASVVVSATSRVSLSFKSMTEDIIRQIAVVTARLLAMRALMSVFAPFAGGGGLGGALFSAFSAPFGGARAGGGNVVPGRTYMVGERGMEAFVPPGAGRIVPNNQLAGAGAGAPNLTLNVAPSRDPISLARDDQWMTALGEMMRTWSDRGGRLG